MFRIDEIKGILDLMENFSSCVLLYGVYSEICSYQIPVCVCVTTVVTYSSNISTKATPVESSFVPMVDA